MISGYRPEFIAGLRRLARVFETYAARTGHRPLLVGGAAASLYSGGAIVSGDFDVIAPFDEVFDEAMRTEGFAKEDRAGRLLVGWYHPELPAIGVQLVTGPPFEGRMDARRVVLVGPDEWHGVPVPPVEDMIADRLGQYAADGSPSMLEQARLLAELAEDVDDDYLRRRVAEEGGDIALLG
jgi:hypothetical protein